jgi:hypothetical protein
MRIKKLQHSVAAPSCAELTDFLTLGVSLLIVTRDEHLTCTIVRCGGAQLGPMVFCVRPCQCRKGRVRWRTSRRMA